MAQDAAGAHPILNAQPSTQLEVRVRGGAWLVFSGGIVGGMLVALVVWLLGLSAALGLSSRGASSATSASTPAATAAATVSTPVLPVPGALKPEATALVPALGTLPGLGNATASLKPTPVSGSALEAQRREARVRGGSEAGGHARAQGNVQGSAHAEAGEGGGVRSRRAAGQ